VASLTTRQLVEEIAVSCEHSEWVEAYTVLYMDVAILKVRVFLLGGYFIEVFYNLDTDKTSFALIQDKSRVYGKDNAKMGWHVHPEDDPERHISCEPVTFSQFLSEVEQILSRQNISPERGFADDH